MSSSLGPLYHWSPRERLNGIKRLGLMPGKRNISGPVYHGTNPDGSTIVDDDGVAEFLQRGVCFSATPARAWDYSHGAWRTKGTFDLWMVELESSDEVHILPQWGGTIVEVRVHNRIPKSRLVWVGERTVS